MRAAARLVLLLAAVAGILLGARALKNELQPKNFAVVEPGFLYRSGDLPPRRARAVLERLRIRRVVWMLYLDPSKSSHRAEQAAIDALGIRSVHLSLHGDGTGKLGRYVDAIGEVAAARRAGEAVLVQCAAGARRSGGVVALYLLLVERRPPDEASRELARFGSREAAARQAEFLNASMERIARQLVQRGTIAAVPEPLPQLRPPARGQAWTWLVPTLGAAAD